MAYNLKWPGLHDLDIYIIDNETKNIYGKKKQLPDRLNAINTLEHKYVRLIDVVSLFPNSMKVRVLNLVETLTSISSLKPLYKDKVSELRFLHLSSLLAFILVYPFCKPFQKTRDAILRFLMDYTETVCMDCGFIQRECQCHVFSSLDDEAGGSDEITEVVCKVSEWKSTGTQTDPSSTTVDPNPTKVIVPLPTNFKLKTSEGQVVATAASSGTSSVISGTMPPIIPQTLIQGPPMYTIPTVTSFQTSFNPLQQMSNMSFNFLGGSTGVPVGSISSAAPNPTLNITPSILPMTPQTMQPAHDPVSGSGFKMGNNFVYIPPEVLNSDNPAHSSEKQDTGKRKNLFRLDPETRLFVSDDFSLDPKTGKVTKNVDTKKEVEGSSETNSSKRRSKKKKQILIGAAKRFATEGRNLSDDLVSKRKKKKRKTVKVLLEKEGKEEKSSGEKKEKSDLPEKSGTETASEAVHQEDNESSELTREEVGDNLVKKDIELEPNVTAIENEKRNTDKEPEDSCSKVSSESKTTTETDNTVQPEADGEDRKTTEQQTKKIIQDKQTNGLNEHPDSERDTDEGTDGTESSSEGEDSESESMSEEDVRIHGGVQYKVISANPISNRNAKPPQLKVKMPFAGKMKSIPIKVKLPQRDPAKSVEASSAPGSILSKCNFSYASSPITGQPVLQQVKKKLKQLNTSDSVSGKSNATSKDKACFSVIPAHNSTDTVKGYAKFEFAQTGEKMLRCIIYTCGQVFDTEQFAEIHHTLHQHGTPKELRCKLCNFKGHVLKWYDMLRHLKHTHGSVINPKILPPKRKKPDEKQSNEEKKSTGKEDGAKKSEKENEGERSTSREANAVVKEDDGTERSNELQKSSPIKEQNDLENSSVNLSNSSVRKAPDETSILKSDGLSALADVCDQLEPMDTSDSSKETTEVSKLNGDSSVSKTENLLDTEESATKKEEKKFDTAVEGQDKAGKVESIPVSNGGGLSSPVKVEENPEAGKAESEISKDDKEGATNTTILKIDGEDNGCDLCGIKFENKKELDTHSTFHYYNKYKCIHCGGIMYTWGHLQRHLKECTDVEKGRVFYNCQYCHLSFRDRKSHYIHSISHGDPGLVCSYCDDDKSWDNWTALKKHYKVFHMAMRLLSAFKCDDCNREFNTAKQYNNHMQDHKRRKERAAKMNKADQKEIDDMKDMEIQVTKDGLVKCPDCEQTFKNNHYMEMHHKFKHGEEISCPKCNYVAKSKLMLKIHMGKAHIEKSHKCGECGKTFAHYHQYKVHLSTHAQKTTFSCKFCQAGYPTNGELRQHMFKEHKLPAHKKLIQCEDCDFKCFSRTTLKAHSRKNHPETTVVEDGEDHCYFNKKEPSPPPKVVNKTKDKLNNQESVEKMLETKSKYFIMRHNTCCRTRSFEQNMEIKNRKVAAEKRLFEGPKKRGRKPKSVTETTGVTEDPEVAEKKDPTWSPKKVENLAADPNVQMGATEKTNRRASCTATPTDDFSQEDIHKIHENRAPNKRRSAPPKRYSPEREIVQVKKRAKSPPIRRPRSPKEKRRPSKSPVYKKRRSFPGTDYDSSLGYLEQQNPLLSSTPYESAQRIKERRRSAKQYEKRLKHEKPTLYAELMHVKKLKSVPMVVDQSASLSVPLLDHCYCRESKPIEQYHGDISYHNPDLSIVTTPEVADFEECLTDDVEIPSPLGAYNRPVYWSDTMTTQHSRRGRGRGRPFGRGPGRVTERKQQPVAMRAVLSGGSVSTLQLTNNSGQFSKLSSHLSDDFGSGVNVRIAGRNTNMTPSTVSQVRTVMASPSDDSMELDSDSLLPPGVDMQDDILKVAADMFIDESEISEEITEASDSEHHISSSSVGESSPYTMTNTIPKYPKPIVIRRPAYEQTANFSRNRVVTISQHGVTEHLQSRVVAEAIPQLSAEPQSVVTENIPQYSADDGEATLETVHLDSDEIVAETSHITNAEAYLEGGTMPGHLSQSENVTLSQTGGSNIVPVTAAEDFQNVESEPVIANEMAQELMQAILEHSRTSDTELDDIHLNEVDYNILLGSRGGISGSSTTVNNENTIQTTNDCTEQRTRSVDHQYF